MQKQQKERALDRLRKAKAYLVLAWDGEKMPVFMYSAENCTNKDDLRHFTMQRCIEGVEATCRNAMDQLVKKMHDIEQSKKVEEVKEKRSEALAKE